MICHFLYHQHWQHSLFLVSRTERGKVIPLPLSLTGPYAALHRELEVSISESVFPTSHLNASQRICSGKHGANRCIYGETTAANLTD